MEIVDMTGLGMAWAHRNDIDYHDWPARTQTKHLATHRAWWSPEDNPPEKDPYHGMPANAASLAALHDGQPRYTHHVLPDGKIEQAWPMWAKTNHAYLKNRTAMGVAVLHSGHKLPLPDIMRESLEWLLLHLRGLYRNSTIVRHDKLANGTNRTKYPNKVCPGDGVPLDEISNEIDTMLYVSPDVYSPAQCRKRLIAAGAVM